MRFITLAALLANAAFTSAIGGHLCGRHQERAVMRHRPHHISVVSEAPTGIDVTVFADAPIPIPTALPAVVDHKKEMLRVLSKINHATLAPEVPAPTSTLVTRVHPRAFPTDKVMQEDVQKWYSMWKA
jgi:hypothetical protein